MTASVPTPTQGADAWSIPRGRAAAAAVARDAWSCGASRGATVELSFSGGSRGGAVTVPGATRVPTGRARCAVPERPVVHRGLRSPGPVQAVHLGQQVGLPATGHRRDEGAVGGHGVAVLDADRAVVVVEQLVVVVDHVRRALLRLRVDASREVRLLGRDVAAEVGELHRGPPDEGQVVGAGRLSGGVEPGRVLGDGVVRAEVARLGVHRRQRRCSPAPASARA